MRNWPQRPAELSTLMVILLAAAEYEAVKSGWSMQLVAEFDVAYLPSGQALQLLCFA